MKNALLQGFQLSYFHLNFGIYLTIKIDPDFIALWAVSLVAEAEFLNYLLSARKCSLLSSQMRRRYERSKQRSRDQNTVHHKWPDRLAGAGTAYAARGDLWCPRFRKHDSTQPGYDQYPAVCLVTDHDDGLGKAIVCSVAAEHR